MHGLKPYPSADTDDYLATLVVQTAVIARRRQARFLQMLLEMAAHEALRLAEGQELRAASAETTEEALDALEAYLRHARGTEPFLIAAVPDEDARARHETAQDVVYGYAAREATRRTRMQRQAA